MEKVFLHLENNEAERCIDFIKIRERVKEVQDLILGADYSAEEMMYFFCDLGTQLSREYNICLGTFLENLSRSSLMLEMMENGNS